MEKIQKTRRRSKKVGGKEMLDIYKDISLNFDEKFGQQLKEVNKKFDELEKKFEKEKKQLRKELEKKFEVEKKQLRKDNKNLKNRVASLEMTIKSLTKTNKDDKEMTKICFIREAIRKFIKKTEEE